MSDKLKNPMVFDKNMIKICLCFGQLAGNIFLNINYTHMNKNLYVQTSTNKSQ